jgi:hypothetical protein
LRAASAVFDIGFLLGLVYGIWYARDHLVKTNYRMETTKTRAS